MYRVAMLCALAGCSLLAVKGPSTPGPTGIDEDCTTSRAWPIVDVSMAVLLVGGAVAALVDVRSSAPSGRSVDRAQGALSMILPGIAYAISAVVGFQRVGECRDQRAIVQP